ncbi:MAG: hypothetical protein ACRD36_08360, partial [Candidatus Acidiferrum sp.]
AVMYRVVWLHAALSELAAAWQEAESAQRQRITAATHFIEHDLRSDPASKGESRAHDHRIHFYATLAITFEVLPTRLTVRVLHVWTFREKN